MGEGGAALGGFTWPNPLAATSSWGCGMFTIRKTSVPARRVTEVLGRKRNPFGVWVHLGHYGNDPFPACRGVRLARIREALQLGGGEKVALPPQPRALRILFQTRICSGASDHPVGGGCAAKFSSNRTTSSQIRKIWRAEPNFENINSVCITRHGIHGSPSPRPIPSRADRSRLGCRSMGLPQSPRTSPDVSPRRSGKIKHDRIR